MAPHIRLRARIFAWAFFTSTVLLAGALIASWMWFRHLLIATPVASAPPALQQTATQRAPVSPLLVSYKLDLPGRGEIFPALASSGDKWPVAILTISNQSDGLVAQALTAHVPGWTTDSQRTLILGPHETRAIAIAPDLLPAAFQNTEVRWAMLKIKVTNPAGDLAFAQDRAVLLHGASDLYWGQRFANAQYVARWVTPHDPAVLKLVSDSRRFAPNGRLRGYELVGTASPARLPQQVRAQVRAIFDALRSSGLSYVTSIYTFGDFVGQAQRIRLPSETLALRNANCIDVSVAFASAIENLGMRPVIVIVPGHAFVGVHLGPQTEDTFYLDLTVLPRGTLSQAEARAKSWLNKFPPGQVLTVDVAAARTMKIYPLTAPEPQQAGAAVAAGQPAPEIEPQRKAGTR